MQSNQIKKVTIAFVLVLSAIVIIILCGSQLVFQKACIRKNRPWPDLGAADKKQFELLTDAYKIKNIPSEQITISASDGIKLTGNYYEREKNAPLIIYFHGLWSNSYIDGVRVPIYRITQEIHCNLVLVNMRAHDNSEGAFSTLGAVEKYDCKEWTNWAVNRFGKQTSIFLMGISMGASSVMLSSSLDLPDSVHGIIDDCGYSSALEMINVNCKNRLPSYIPVGVFDFFINIGTKMWGKFSLSETDACDALSKTNIPVLIIHGNADTQAPLYIAYRLYNSCRSEKSLLIVNDAGHAESYSKDPDTYEKTVKEFIQKHL